jgi:hypothetical protein
LRFFFKKNTNAGSQKKKKKKNEINKKIKERASWHAREKRAGHGSQMHTPKKPSTATITGFALAYAARSSAENETGSGTDIVEDIVERNWKLALQNKN